MSIIPFPEPTLESGQQLNVWCELCGHSKTFHMQFRCAAMRGDSDGMWVCACPGFIKKERADDDQG